MNLSQSKIRPAKINRPQFTFTFDNLFSWSIFCWSTSFQSSKCQKTSQDMSSSFQLLKINFYDCQSKQNRKLQKLISHNLHWPLTIFLMEYFYVIYFIQITQTSQTSQSMSSSFQPFEINFYDCQSKSDGTLQKLIPHNLHLPLTFSWVFLLDWLYANHIDIKKLLQVWAHHFTITSRF